MNLQQSVTISTEVLAQEVSGEMVLLDLSSEQYLGLNEVGARVWKLLEEEKDLELIFEKLLEEYDVEADLLKNDLVQLVTDMSETGIIALEKKEP